MTDREQAMRTWLTSILGHSDWQLSLVSGDASFRCYFRVTDSECSRIVMDAPPEKESCDTFVAIARMFHGFGLHVPEILAEDHDQGFLLLSDLGDTQYLDVLNEGSVDRLYGDAMTALVRLQASQPGDYRLPDYDRALLLTEMDLFRDWYLGRHLGIELSPEEDEVLRQTWQLLADSALEQPLVPVHRDYHSRNLMLVENNNPGIIDFQDAVMGPVTYDLVSLLRDCYIRWPRVRVQDWVLGYLDTVRQSGIVEEVDEQQFLRWFDLMGVQRHLKASGIFARLNYRDSKPGYLGDIPRTLGYVREVVEAYPELSGFADVLHHWLPPETDLL